MTDITPSLQGSVLQREALDQRSPGLDVVDCSDIVIGNDDLGVPEWLPTVVHPGSTPLPGHEHLMNHEAIR